MFKTELELDHFLANTILETDRRKCENKIILVWTFMFKIYICKHLFHTLHSFIYRSKGFKPVNAGSNK